MNKSPGRGMAKAGTAGDLHNLNCLNKLSFIYFKYKFHQTTNYDLTMTNFHFLLAQYTVTVD